MKSMKKAVTLFLISSFLLSMLIGCSNGANSPEKTSSLESSKASGSTAAAVSSDPNDEILSQFGELHPKMLSKIQTGSKVPTQDILTSIWREKTKVIPEISEIPFGQDLTNWLQMQITAGTLPDIIVPPSGIFDDNNRYGILKKAGELREIKLEDLKKYMPRVAERLKNYGMTVEDWYSANVDSSDGKLWTVPLLPDQVLRKDAKGTRYFESSLGKFPYSVWMRDDILKKIYPQAKTEAELKELYAQKQGKLTLDDVTDIPIKNGDDLFDYCMKVKDLNMKVGDKDIIPMLPVSDGSDQGSYMWSMFTFPGFWWGELGDRIFNIKTGTFEYFAATPGWKDWMKWLNKSYNAGLMGKDFFLLKPGQRDARVINGEYAVFQEWLPVEDATKKSLEENRGYGFRLLPLFMIPLSTQYQDMTREEYPIKSVWGTVGIGKSVKEKDIPQILHWIDWNLSEEAAELRAWGTPEMYTGDKEERRFKPEYKELEAWAIGEAVSEKDGVYYGLYGHGESIDVAWNAETYGIGGANYELTYLWAPNFVYPLSSDSFNVGDATRQAVAKHYAEQQTFVRVGALSKEAMDARAAFNVLEEAYSKIKNVSSYDCDGSKLATVKMINGKPEEFEKNYEAWYKKYITPELMDSIAKQGEAWNKYLKARESSIHSAD